ncbi:hypothetical protein COOONC_15654 [Cooperia oncophora]
MLYALLWWFAHKSNKAPHKIPEPTAGAYKWTPIDIIPMTDFEFENVPSSRRFVPHRMQFTLGPLCRTWDLALCDDSFSILLYNETTMELLLTQRFRPAALIGRARHLSKAGILLDAIDWKSQPLEWAYTLEMCSGHYKTGTSVDEIEQRVKDAVAKKCGYNIQSIRFVTSFIVGISFAGDRQRAYYARVINESSAERRHADSIRGYHPASSNELLLLRAETNQTYGHCLDKSSLSGAHSNNAGPREFPVPCSAIPSLLRAEEPTGPPAVLYMMQWFLNSNEK